MRLKVHEHPSLRRRVGAMAETLLLFGTALSIWSAIAIVLISALLARDIAQSLAP